MLLIQLLIIKVFVISSCLASGQLAEVENADVAGRDKRAVDLGLLVRNLLQISAAKAPAARQMPRKMTPVPPMQPMPTMAPMMMPQAPAPAPPVLLPAIFGLKTYEYRPDPTYYTDKNGYINFNTNENYVLATAVATPAPPVATTMAPPPPAPALQPTLKQQQQAAFINFLSTLSGFPPAPATMPPPPAKMPPPPATMPPPPTQTPGAILIPKRLLPFQQQLRENVIYQYSQPYDSSSESQAPQHIDSTYHNGQSQENYYPHSEDSHSDGRYYYEGEVGSQENHGNAYTNNYDHAERQQYEPPSSGEDHEQHSSYGQHESSSSPHNSFRISYPDDSDYYQSKDYADTS